MPATKNLNTSSTASTLTVPAPHKSRVQNDIFAQALLSDAVIGNIKEILSQGNNNPAFDEDAIVAAAKAVCDDIIGTSPTVAIADVKMKLLGCSRGSLEWDRRDEVISSSRISNALRKAGWVSVRGNTRGRPGRYAPPDSMRVAVPEKSALLNLVQTPQMRRVMKEIITEESESEMQTEPKTVGAA
ncbi:MAG: hypothetical protein Q4Q04_05230 [Methanocorpusculum sp.]|nr:hypothetical protein [Methanocorpusculum sp.]